jgi:hypothetical protein
LIEVKQKEGGTDMSDKAAKAGDSEGEVALSERLRERRRALKLTFSRLPTRQAFPSALFRR